MRSLAHGISYQPVNPDGRKDQRKQCEAAHQTLEKRVTVGLTLKQRSHAHNAGQGKLSVHLRHCVAHGSGQVVRIETCANHERKRRNRTLKHRLVNLRLHASGFGMTSRIADNADDLAPLRGGAAYVEPNLFSEWFLVLQMPMHKLLADQHDAWRAGIVPLCKHSAAQQRDARSLKEFRSYHEIERGGPLVRGQFGLALNQKGDFARSRCRQIRCNRHRLGAWNLLEVQQHISDERGLLGGILILRVVESHTGGKDMVRPEAHVLMMNDGKSANQQPGTDQQKQRQRDFAGDHHGPQAALRTARGRGAALILQARVDVGARRVQRRNQATQRRGGHGDRQNEEHNIPVQANRYRTHVFVEAHVCPDKVDSPIRR